MALFTKYPSTPQPTGAGGTLPSTPDPQPVPYRATPPWGEPPIYDEIQQAATPLPEINVNTEDELLHNSINLAYGHLALQLDWQNDDQYGYPPPGAPNDQPFQSGHTSITVMNQSAEQGWGTDPAFAWPRYPHMENKFPGYNQYGVFRRNGQWPATKLTDPMYIRMQQHRDLQLRHAVRHRVHGAIVADAPSVTHTQNTMPIDPTTGWPEPIGPEGVLPT